MTKKSENGLVYYLGICGIVGFIVWILLISTIKPTKKKKKQSPIDRLNDKRYSSRKI